MTYQDLDIGIKALQLVLSIGTAVAVVVLWFNGRNKATKDAIDRVEAKATKDALAAETKARDRHSDQEARLIRLEEEIRHVISKKELDAAISPLYDLVRKQGENTAAIGAKLDELSKDQREFRNIVLNKGMNA